MKNVLLYLLVFISLNTAAQAPIRDVFFATTPAQVELQKKVQSIFASQYYTISVAYKNNVQTYALTKYKTPRHTYFMLEQNGQSKKVIWANYEDLQWKLKQTAYTYYTDTLSLQKPVPNYATYTISNINQTITFPAEYMNIEKRLCNIEWTPNPHYHTARVN